MDFTNELNPGIGPKSPEISFFDARGLKMMAKMGYKEGQGLGKANQGLVSHLEVNNKQDRRGLGFQKPVHPLLENVNWDISTEILRVRQEVSFISSDLDSSDMSLDDLRSWVEFAPTQKDYPMEPKYCDPILQEEVLSGKELLGQVDGETLANARSRANPFETIHNAIFLNRAALKMANIDAACNFMFTNIENDEHHRTCNKPIYFADVCAGPGGFSEYILWKKKWFYKGFGFTLQGKHDFQLSNFWAGSPATFQNLYGVKHDGNVYDPENIEDFRDKVLSQTDNKGVHFMMADGGFNVDGFENLQEVLSKKIYLCQCLVAMSIVRENGHFVTKLFDTFTTFTVGLIYLMYRCFDEIGIFKPNASRPANSERYLVCKRRRKNTENIRDYFMHIVRELWYDDNLDVMKIVPEDVINTDEQFMKYIVNTNHSFCERQINSLKKLMVFHNDAALHEPRQTDLKMQCLKFWQIPNETRLAPIDIIPGEYISNLIKNPDLLLCLPNYLKSKNDLLNNLTQPINDWNIFLLNCDTRPQYKFYLACGGARLYELNQNNWQLSMTNIELPSGSLILAEEVKELHFEDSKKSVITSCLHVIDAFQLGDLNISCYSLAKRQDLIQIFCEAVNHPHRKKTVNIRIKPCRSLSSCIKDCPTKMIQKKGKDKLMSELPTMCNQRMVYFPGYILFVTGGDFLSSYPQRQFCQLVSESNSEEGISWMELSAFVQSQTKNN